MLQERIMPKSKQEQLQQGDVAVTSTVEKPPVIMPNTKQDLLQQCAMDATTTHTSPLQASTTTARAYDIADEIDQLRHYQELEQRTKQLETERSNAPQARVICVEQASKVEDEATKPKNGGKDKGRWIVFMLLLIVIIALVALIVAFGMDHQDNEHKNESDVFNDKLSSGTGNGSVPTSSPSTSLQSSTSMPIAASSKLTPTLERIHERGFIRCCDVRPGPFAFNMVSEGLSSNSSKQLNLC